MINDFENEIERLKKLNINSWGGENKGICSCCCASHGGGKSRYETSKDTEKEKLNNK